MGKKNWIEFDNEEKKSEETAKLDSFNKRSCCTVGFARRTRRPVEGHRLALCPFPVAAPGRIRRPCGPRGATFASVEPVSSAR